MARGGLRWAVDHPARFASVVLLNAGALVGYRWHWLARIWRTPVVVWGAQDPYIPVEQAERQRESFPSAEVHVLADSGHWPMVDDPDRVREVVLPFLRRVVGA